MAQVHLPIEGMTCAACATRLEKVLNRVDGVESASVSLASERASLGFQAGQVAMLDLLTAVENAGFEVPTETIRLDIQGMTCATCSGRVETVLRAVDGVRAAQVNLANDVATVAVAAGAVDGARLVKAVEDAGYGAIVASSDASRREENAAREAAVDRRDLVMLIGAATLSAPLVLPMVLMPFGIHLMPPGWVQLLLALPVQVFAGARFYRGAWGALRGGSANMDVLVALGTSAAFAVSLVELIAGGELYFESAAVVITLVMFGKWLERRARRSTTRAVEALMALRPETARVSRNGAWVEVPAGAVGRGDVVQVRPGERVPVDGEIVSGESTLDESLMTGESLPVAKAIGDSVTGGAINGEGMLQVRAEAVGADSALSRIIAMVEDASAAKAPIQKTVDRVSAIFVPVVVAIAVLTLGGWLLAGESLEHAILVSVAVLVIACPCALGLATPTALMVGTGAAARAGILFKDAEALERAHAVTLVVFDKTGTLTLGQPQVRAVWAQDGDEDALLTVLAAAQGGSEHPLGKAIVDEAERRSLTVPSADEVRAVPGRGLEATVAGRTLRAGSPTWMQTLGHDLQPIQDAVQDAQQTGTVMLVELDGTLAGWVGVFDPPRDTAAQAIAGLRASGVKTIMLTGDNARTAEHVGRIVGVDRVIAEVLPGGKAEEIQRLQAAGEVVAMVGDGVNDAPALAAADVGIAMSTGSDVAMHTAGVTLMRAEPLLVADTIAISRATTRKIKQNLFWAFGYNTLGLPLAAAGMLSPVIAGGAMAMSSVSVVSNALLLHRWRPQVAD